MAPRHAMVDAAKDRRFHYGPMSLPKPSEFRLCREGTMRRGLRLAGGGGGRGSTAWPEAKPAESRWVRDGGLRQVGCGTGFVQASIRLQSRAAK